MWRGSWAVRFHREKPMFTGNWLPLLSTNISPLLILLRYRILLLLFVPAVESWAQEIPRVFNYLPESYHAQRQNWSVDQSPEMLMYFANNKGLLEYDGTHWQTFLLPNKSTVRSVVCGGDKVFCGGFSEFGYWKKEKNGLLKYYSLADSLQDERINKEEIWHIIDAGKRVYFQSFSTIYEYDYQKVTKYSPPGNIMFLQKAGGRIIFQVIEKGLCEFADNHAFRYIPGGEIFADKIVSAILPASEGNGFWVFTLNHGIYFYDGQTFKPWQNAVIEKIKKFQINKAIRLSDGKIAIGTILDGLYLLDSAGSEVLHLNQLNGLQNNTVLNLKEDGSGNLWATLDKGISMVELASPLTYYTDLFGKTGAVYTAALHNDYLYLGTNRGVFYRKKSQPGGEYRLIEGTQGQVWQLVVKDGQLLCGHNEGTFLIVGDKAVKISPVTGGWKIVSHPVLKNVLIQGTYTGLTVFRQNAAGKWAFSGRVEGFLDPVKDIVFDKKGFIWGTHPNKGVYRILLNEQLNKIQEIKYFTKEDGLPDESGLRLFLSESGSVWVQTDTLLLEENNQQFEVVGEVPEFPFTALKYMPAANGDWFGLSSDNVYYQYGSQSAHFEIRLIEDNENIVPLDPDTWLFCMEDGYALLNKAYIERYKTKKKISPIIRKFEIIGQKDEEDIPSPGNNGVYTLSSSMNDIHFAFAIPDYTRRPLFRYQLKGFSKGWSSWQKETMKEFTNLPPGDYTFLLQSDLSDLTTFLNFRILSPWYLSWKGLLVLVLLLGLLYYLLQKTIARSLSQQRKHLQVENEKALEKQRIESANEVLKTEITGKNRELANSTMNLLRKNEMLASIKEELLRIDEENFRKSIRRMMRLIEEHNTTDHDWEVFEDSFNSVHENFIKRLKGAYPDLTPGDLRLAAYLKMNISTKEIAQLLSISIRGVENKRYRLRKKMNLPDSVHLTDFMINY